jgi:phage shock protein A
MGNGAFNGKLQQGRTTMGIFTRLRDIVSSNLNAILDHAEDPEKMVRLMIQEMEDTLIEVKSNCAGVIADQKRLQRLIDAARADVADWEAKARLAVEKGRDDLARAALVEKKRHDLRVEGLEREMEAARTAVAGFKEDIAALEAKLADAREKQRSIIQRRAAAVSRKTTAGQIRRIDTSEAFAKFEAYERGIERLEAEAEIHDSLRPKQPTLREQLATLEHQDEVEQELSKLKRQVKGEAEPR